MLRMWNSTSLTYGRTLQIDLGPISVQAFAGLLNTVHLVHTCLRQNLWIIYECDCFYRLKTDLLFANHRWLTKYIFLFGPVIHCPMHSHLSLVRWPVRCFDTSPCMLEIQPERLTDKLTHKQTSPGACRCLFNSEYFNTADRPREIRLRVREERWGGV